MEELARAIVQFSNATTGGGDLDLDWLWALNDLIGSGKSQNANISVLQLDPKSLQPFIGFLLFIISEIILGFVGYYAAAATTNNHWQSSEWEWDEVTAVNAAGGGVDGGFIPYAFYYSMNVIGFEATTLLTLGGGYLGAAAENRDWDVLRWNWLSPATFNSWFVGIQQTLWLVDALSYIPMFTKNLGLEGWAETAFISVTYAFGAVISYNNIAQDYQGNYNFKEWDLAGPVVMYGMVRGFQTGTRWPVGVSEIGLDALRALDKSRGERDVAEAFIKNFVIKKRWQIAGALWYAWILTSVENDSFGPKKWDTTSFGTFEAIMNGIVVGKDIEGSILDIRRLFLGSRSADMANPTTVMVGTKNKIQMAT